MRRERHRNFTLEVNATAWCECGQKKSKARYACDRCRYLDGTSVAEFDLIQLIREASDGMSIVSLAAETGRFSSAVYRTLHKLEREGRVTRHADVEGRSDGGLSPLVYRLRDGGGTR